MLILDGILEMLASAHFRMGTLILPSDCSPALRYLSTHGDSSQPRRYPENILGKLFT